MSAAPGTLSKVPRAYLLSRQGWNLVFCPPLHSFSRVHSSPVLSFFLPRGSCLDSWSGLVNCLPSHSSALYLCHCMEARSRAPRRQPCPPGITWLALAYLLSCLLASSKAKVFSRCELAKVLHDFGLEGYRGYNLADCENPSPHTLHSPPVSMRHQPGGGGQHPALSLLLTRQATGSQIRTIPAGSQEVN